MTIMQTFESYVAVICAVKVGSLRTFVHSLLTKMTPHYCETLL